MTQTTPENNNAKVHDVATKKVGEDVAHLESNLSAEFQEVDIADLLPLQHVKRYLADTDFESLRLSKTGKLGW